MAKILANFFGILSTIFITKWYGADILGTLAILNSFLAIATIFSLVGSNTAILRMVPEYKNKYSPSMSFLVFKKLSKIIICVSIFIGIIIFFSSSYISDDIFNKPHLKFLFLLSSIILLFRSFEKFSISGLRAVKKIKTFSIIQALIPFSNFIIIIFISYFSIYKYAPIYIQFITTILFSIICIIIVNRTFIKETSNSDIISKISYSELLKTSLPMFLTSSILVIIGKAGILLLSVYVSEEEVAYYSIALKIGMILTFILQSINQVIAPKFSDLFFKKEIDRLFKIARQSTKMMFWVLIFIIICFIAFGKWFFISFYGASFESSYYLLLIISCGFFINAICGSNGYFLNMCGYEREMTITMSALLIFNIVSNLVLLPYYGIYGAAIVFALTQIVKNLILTLIIKYNFNKTFIYIPFITN